MIVVALAVFLALWILPSQRRTLNGFAPASGSAATASAARKRTAAADLDDPYADFRNTRYSNDGLLSERDETRLGEQLHREVLKRYRLADSDSFARAERIGSRAAKASLRPNLAYRFYVLQSREINGFSIPGGHVYVTTALMKLANDDELASALAHEVSHVVARHSLRMLKE